MKKIVTTPEVDFALRTLGPEEVRRVHAWFDHLANWDDDSFVRGKARSLSAMPGVQVVTTTSDIWIFFAIEGDVITVLDVARKQAILKTVAN